MLAVFGCHPVGHAIVDLRRQRLLLGEQLGDHAVAGLHAPRRGGDGHALATELVDGVVHPVRDELAELVLGDARPVQEPARFDVVDDVHHLQHQAGHLPQPRLALPARVEEEVLHLGWMRHRVADVIAEGGTQIVDGLVEDALEPRAVEGIVGLEQAEPQVAVHLVLGLEVEPPPVDHRPAAQDQPHPLQVSERPLLGQRNGRVRDHGRRGSPFEPGTGKLGKRAAGRMAGAYAP